MKEGLAEGEKISPSLYRNGFGILVFLLLLFVSHINVAHIPVPRHVVSVEEGKTIDNQVAEASVERDKERYVEVKGSIGIEQEKIPFHGIILEAASRYQVDPALIRAIIMAESGYNPKAVSKKGAVGLMQLMPRTARELGVEEPFNPKHNIEAGVKYFKKLLKQFNGDVALALAAYNAGSRKVRKYRGVPPIAATRYYVNKVFHYYKKYKQEMKSTKTDSA